MSFNLQLERIFSLYQCNKVLGFMGLTYNNIHEPGEKNAYLRKNLYQKPSPVPFFGITLYHLTNFNAYRFKNELEWVGGV